MRQTAATSTLTPVISCTGDRIDGRFRVDMDGVSALLRPASLKILLALVLERADAETGFLRVSRGAAFRLRADLAAAIGLDPGKKIIETGGTNEYRIAIPRAQLKTRTLLTPCFAELAQLRIVTRKQLARLKRICGRAPSLND